MPSPLFLPGLDADPRRYQIGNHAVLLSPCSDGNDLRIISERRLTEFWTRHPAAEKPLKVWRRLLRYADYGSPHEVKSDFPAADFLGGNVAVFDIGGNKYRLVVSMRYDLQRVYIRHVLTHGEYERRRRDGTL